MINGMYWVGLIRFDRAMMAGRGYHRAPNIKQFCIRDRKLANLPGQATEPSKDNVIYSEIYALGSPEKPPEGP